MDMQNVSSLQIPEGIVRTIHDKDNRLLWGRVAYNTKYAGNTIQNGTPTPDIPVPVQTVTGKQTVKVSGKNLFDKNTAVLYNGYFSAGGSIAGDDLSDLTKGTNRFFYIPCEPNTTYSITKPLQPTTSRNRFRVGTQPVLNITNGATLNDFWRMSDGGTTTTYTITTGANANYLFVYFANATTATDPGGEVQGVLDGLQIEKGSTTAYEPYRGQSYVVDLRGANLLDLDSFVIGGMSSGVPSPTTKYRINNADKPIKVEPDTDYTISAQLVSPVQGFRVGIHECQADGTFIRDLGWQQLATAAKKFTTGSTTGLVKIVGSLSTTSTDVTTGGTENTTACNTVSEFMRGCTLMLEEGSSASVYQPYNPIELCKLGEYQDYIYKSGDDWYIHKETGKDTLDGTEIFQKSGVNDNVSFYWSRNYTGQVLRFANIRESLITQTGAGIDYVFPFFSNIFPRMSTNQVIYSSSIGAGFNRPSATNLNFRMGMGLGTTINDVTKFTNFVRDNPITVYYPLETFTNTQITDATLIGQLSEVHGWLTRYGYNIAVDGILPIIIDKTNL